MDYDLIPALHHFGLGILLATSLLKRTQPLCNGLLALEISNIEKNSSSILVNLVHEVSKYQGKALVAEKELKKVSGRLYDLKKKLMSSQRS